MVKLYIIKITIIIKNMLNLNGGSTNKPKVSDNVNYVNHKYFQDVNLKFSNTLKAMENHNKKFGR